MGRSPGQGVGSPALVVMVADLVVMVADLVVMVADVMQVHHNLDARVTQVVAST